MSENGVTLMNPPSNSMQRLVIETRMKQAFGSTDFSGVRTHADANGGGTSAQAYVTGNNVFFGPGSKDANNQLLAHELTHVMQQTGGVVR